MISNNLNEFVSKMNWLEDEGFDSGSLIEDANEAWFNESGEKAWETVEEMEKDWNDLKILVQVLENITSGHTVGYNL